MDVGVIGTGVMGKNHARVYSELKSVGDVIVYDINTEAASDIAKKTGTNVAGSLDDLFRQVDAVSICVPTEYHYETALKAAAAGVHMLIEKPVCLTSAEATALCEKIPDELVVGVGHIERLNPIVEEIRRIVKDPIYVEIKRHNPASMRITGGSVVEDLMIHDIDIIFNNCCFRGAYNLSCSGNNDICGALFDFEKVPVYLSASRKASKKIRMIYIEEEDFTIEGDFMTQEVFVHRKPERYTHESERYVQENVIEKVMVNKIEPLKMELSTFVQCAKEGREFPITPAQAIRNVQICEEIKQKCARKSEIQQDSRQCIETEGSL
ncbi:Gfo/Idh/MocA family oxidoreductase [Methanogenium sp. S4BF]|uniref:Gfo/Idh/MocA family protein n=1 Tax=Methanogenium sp. S4BF TaxID=1789226 RepID=UPI002416CCD2|nr:Gfo/Idh/MocA family oxidoreductase [Methanogenium sp. S4BF]WFN35111.1 Gfo/Idh/MocA family oxidoreductase [Methanogenium sp. S4BF]